MRLVKLMIGISAFLAPLLAYIRIAAPETPPVAYGLVVSGYLWGAMSVIIYLLWATRNLRRVQPRELEESPPKTLDEWADQVVEIDLPGKDTPIH